MNERMPFRQRVANRVFDALEKAAEKVGIPAAQAERFVLRSLLMPDADKPREKPKHAHRAPGVRRDARRRQKQSRRAQLAAREYRRP